ncbi:[pyruvate dehydrogenase (acetyl-transferring)] kinase [Ranunculus cassubicifolius]
MGCICSKGASTATSENADSNQREKDVAKAVVTPSKREEMVMSAEGGMRCHSSVANGLLKPNLMTPGIENGPPALVGLDDGAKSSVANVKTNKGQHQRRATVDVGANGADRMMSRIVSMPHAVEGEQVAAGWPSWLSAVAGEAIKGWLPRRADSFEKLDKIGQGTYSNVYRARDLETGKIVALKKVRFVNMDPESVRFMAREIHILRRLDHPNVIKLEGLVTSRMSGSLYLVFEYMEHDLAGLAASPDIKFTEAQIKCYMQQLICGLEHCHGRGVLHRDIKGSNLLIDNNGILRIADFGLATFFNADQAQPMTSRVVTLWYRPPELLLGATEYGVGVDLWSSGCILAELFAGKPIMPGRTEVEQMHKIFKLCGSPSEEYWKRSKLPHATIFKPQHPYQRCTATTFKDLPSSALALTDVLLAIEPESRGTATEALKSDFFTTKPYPCDPSTLPKYRPSKEFDAKLRDEEARRQRAAAKDSEKDSRNSKKVQVPDANLERQISLQKRQPQPNPKSISEKYNPQDDSASGFPIDPPPSAYGSSSSWNKKGVESISRGFGSSRNPELRSQRSYMPHGTSDHATLTNSRSSARLDQTRDRNSHPRWAEKHNQLDDGESSHHLLDRPASSHKKGDKGYGQPKKNRIHYSGPLMPPGGNLDDMLKEHERQIQQAVRKARLDKVKTKKNMDDAQEALLHARNGR